MRASRRRFLVSHPRELAAENESMRQLVVAKSALKACLPFLPQLRALKRRFSPYRDDPENSADVVGAGLHQIRLLRSQNVPISGDVLEFGSGWLPIIPLLFKIAGARKLILTDVERLMEGATIARAKHVILNRIDAVATALDLAAEEVQKRLQAEFSPDYIVPWDCRTHPAASADIIISRTVLEHVRPEYLSTLMDEWARILRPNGVMCHIIDNSDHWSHRDRSLSKIDFLRYDDNWYWRLRVLDAQHYQNRLRHSDYAKEFRRHGWDVLVDHGEPHAQCLLDLLTFPLAPRFRGRDPRDLAVLISTFVLRHDGSGKCR